MSILIIAPHPDDEILGCGGAIAKYSSKKNEVFVAVITKAGPPLFEESFVEQGRKEALKAHELLKVKETIFCDLPAAYLDNIAHIKVNEVISNLISDIKPSLLFIPHISDLHLDHQRIFLSSLVASRPNTHYYPKKILAYETLSETNWNAPYLTPGFHPNIFIDISDFLKIKLRAFECYQSQIKPFPHERSLATLEALAIVRGSTVNCRAAEAFILIREVIE